MPISVGGPARFRSKRSRLRLPELENARHESAAALKPICAAHVVPVMRPIEFEILLSLAAGARHGYAIIQDIEARGDDADVRVETGTLYRALQRLVEQGLVVPTEPRPAAPDDDARRRYYDLTPAGRHAAAAEARRLARLVDSARGLRLIPRSAG